MQYFLFGLEHNLSLKTEAGTKHIRFIYMLASARWKRGGGNKNRPKFIVKQLGQKAQENIVRDTACSINTA